VLNEKSLADVAIVIEGRFDPVKFGAATRKDAKAFRSVRIAGFDVWECSIPPPHAQQYYMALLDPRRLVITYTKEGMAEVLRQAGGKARSAPSRGMQLLMTQARQEHIAVVVKPTQVILRILQDELNRQAPFGLGDWVAAFGKYANDIVIMSGGLSFREKALRVQIGLDMKSRAAAKGLGQCIAGGNRAAAFLLGFAAEELPRLYADILRKERVRVKESAVIIEADVPYTFIQKVLQAPWP
jgi:hypothetical protein